MTKEQSQKTSDIPLKDLKKNPLHTWVELKEKEKDSENSFQISAVAKGDDVRKS